MSSRGFTIYYLPPFTTVSPATDTPLHVQLLLVMPERFSIFNKGACASAAAAATVSNAAERKDGNSINNFDPWRDATVQEVLQLPAPLSRLWFQRVTRLTLDLDSTNRPDACTECVSALASAASLQFLSIDGGPNGCTRFRAVKHALLGKLKLSELQLHGVEIAPSDLPDFAMVMHETCLGGTLQCLTLCRCISTLAVSAFAQISSTFASPQPAM